MSKRRVDDTQLAELTTKGKVADLFLSGKSPLEIGEELGITREGVEYHLRSIEEQMLTNMSAFAERISLFNLARLQKIVQMVMPKALEGDLKYVRALLDVIKMQQDIGDKMKPKRDSTQIAIHIENFEQTLSSSNPLYSIAQENMQTAWLDETEVEIVDMYNQIPDTTPEYDNQKIDALLAKVESKLDEEDA